MVFLCIRTNWHAFVAAAVAGCYTSCSIDAVHCTTTAVDGKGVAEVEQQQQQQQGATRGLLQETRCEHGIPRTLPLCHGPCNQTTMPTVRTSLMAVRGRCKLN